MVEFFMENKTLFIKLKMTELDHHITTELREEIDYIIDNNQVKNIVFDFSTVRFMDSSGIGVIIGRYKKVCIDGGKVDIINANDRVKKVFNLSGMNKIVNIYDEKTEAISSL